MYRFLSYYSVEFILICFFLPLVISGLHVIAKNQANLLERQSTTYRICWASFAADHLLKGHRTDEKISEIFARAQIIADTMEVVLQPMRRVGR
jgi:hypothetical protein